MNRRFEVIGVLLILGVVGALAGCASVQQRVGGWFGMATPTPTATPMPAAAAAAPRVYYSGSEGLVVYSGPSSSSKVIGKLALHEKVMRTKRERGYAYVESATGVKGWVKNAQLIWRLPAAPAETGAAPAQTQPEEQPAPEPEAAQAPSVPEPEVAPEAPVVEPTAAVEEVPPTPTPVAVPAEPRAPQPTPRGPAPSIFDAY